MAITVSTPAVAIDEIGNTSRGQYTLLISARFWTMLTAPFDSAPEKNVHGSSPT